MTTARQECEREGLSRLALGLHESRTPKHAPTVLLFQPTLSSEIAGSVLGLARYLFGKYLAVAAAAELPYALVPSGRPTGARPLTAGV